jgi:hypothetical protein
MYFIFYLIIKVKDFIISCFESLFLEKNIKSVEYYQEMIKLSQAQHNC